MSGTIRKQDYLPLKTKTVLSGRKNREVQKEQMKSTTATVGDSGKTKIYNLIILDKREKIQNDYV